MYLLRNWILESPSVAVSIIQGSTKSCSCHYPWIHLVCKKSIELTNIVGSKVATTLYKNKETDTVGTITATSQCSYSGFLVDAFLFQYWIGFLRGLENVEKHWIRKIASKAWNFIILAVFCQSLYWPWEWQFSVSPPFHLYLYWCRISVSPGNPYKIITIYYIFVF